MTTNYEIVENKKIDKIEEHAGYQYVISVSNIDLKSNVSFKSNDLDMFNPEFKEFIINSYLG